MQNLIGEWDVDGFIEDYLIGIILFILCEIMVLNLLDMKDQF
jgi:hypothetical protein